MERMCESELKFNAESFAVYEVLKFSSWNVIDVIVWSCQPVLCIW